VKDRFNQLLTVCPGLEQFVFGSLELSSFGVGRAINFFHYVYIVLFLCFHIGQLLWQYRSLMYIGLMV
jgi:hypothetical protein